MKTSEQILDKWLNGEPFAELATEHKTTPEKVAWKITEEVYYPIASDYYIVTRDPFIGRDFCLVKEMQALAEKYEDDPDARPCTLNRAGIYLAHEVELRKIIKAMRDKTFTVVNPTRYKKVINLYDEHLDDPQERNDGPFGSEEDTLNVTADCVSAKLNAVPDHFELVSVVKLNKRRIIGIYHAPELSILT